jgi:2',3'-cyclic-nucleotide 2'-phosphodiesterase (5'-nucleotidase family)
LVLAVALLGPGLPEGGHYAWTVAAQQEEPGSPRAAAPLTILQINDVYSTVPIDGAGGLARVATLKRQMAAAGRTPFLMLAGDFLSSSVASTVFKGEQMVAALNAAGLDLATLGNHEFDFGVDVLLRRMGEARWQWVVSNVIDRRTGRPVGGAAPYVVKTFGSLRVGFIGLCLTSEGIRADMLKQLRLIPPLEAADTALAALKRERVDVVVALTHLTFAEDRALAERHPEIDLIVGGHEHFPITATENRTLISKAGSDAKFVARIDVNRRPRASAESSTRTSAAPPQGVIERFYELIPITSALADEPGTAGVVNACEARLGPELEAVVGTTRAPLDGVTVRLRAAETNLGNLVADAMRADAGADLAIVNAGGIRGDRVHQAGPLTRRTLVEILPFGNVVCTVAVLGRIVLEALENGVSKLPDVSGQFPQVSGVTLRVDPSAPAGRRLRDVRVQGKPIDAARSYTVAIPDFVLLGGDGYGMFKDARVIVGPESGDSMVTALQQFVAKAGEVTPQVDGRIAIGK